MRKALDLFANIRPVKVPEEGINWTIFRENTEGGYAVGSSGFNVTDDLAVDFTVTTKQGSDRIARLAYDYARRNGMTRVSLVTKANVIKTTDGNFLEDCHKVADLYPEITTDEWYADIMTAKLVDTKRRRDFQVLLLPNLYGDIISDEAAEFQGGVGTAGCANIGKKYAMFEAIHGSAPRMVKEGRAIYADPCSMLRAAVMLLSHIGFTDYARKNGRTRVSLVTKANIIKTTDGNFLEDCHKVAELYPEITTDEWYADIMTAKLVDQKRRKDFQILLLPNLYGDIISDEAAEFQGGVGTAGCANIGKKYAMFEAIHGSAPRMVSEGRACYADPCSMLRASVMLLSHIGYQDRADRLERALDICSFEEKKLVITGRPGGATCTEYADYVMQTLKSIE
jgi:isocitrate/isopropylmalate dehydrogenase